MKIFKRWMPGAEEKLPEPTAQEKAEAESFKQILKYGEDIGGMWKDITARQDLVYKEKQIIKGTCEKAIIRQQGIKLKKYTHHRHDWNDIYIREYRDCGKSPLGCCVTMIEYGSDNPEKDYKQKCFYCSEKY